MTKSTYILRFLFGPLLLLSTAAVAARAQPAITPAVEVRVVEFIDPTSGLVTRRVAEDLWPEEIARVQRALAAAGFVAGRATGRWNAETRSALGRFQSARGLTRCECVSYETVVALGIRPAVVAVVHAPLDRGYGSDVLVVLPHRGVGAGHRSAVVVGHGPSVFVGHHPARGAGQGRHPHVRDPRPPRPRPGVSVGGGAGAPLRAITPPRPRTRSPFPRPATAAPSPRSSSP